MWWMIKMNMRPWKGITTTLEAYECWHGAMAGMVEADNGGWHRMDWYISFIALFSYWCFSVFSIACFFSNWWWESGPRRPQMYFHMHECWMGTWYRWFMHTTGFLYNGWIFEACSETGMFTIVWLCINWFVSSSLTMERNFSLETALVNVQWIGDFICSWMDYDVHMNLFLQRCNCWKLAFVECCAISGNLQ